MPARRRKPPRPAARRPSSRPLPEPAKRLPRGLPEAALLAVAVDPSHPLTHLLRSTLDRLVALTQRARTLLWAEDEATIGQALVTAIGDVVGPQRACSVFLAEAAADGVEPKPAAIGSFVPLALPRSPSATGPLRGVSNAILTWAAGSGQPVHLTEGPWSGWTLVPLSARGELPGVLCVDTRSLGDAVTEDVLHQLAFLGQQAGAALRLHGLLRTIRSQAEGSARAEAHLAHILDSISHGIITTDLNGRVTQINRNAGALLDIADPVPYGKVMLDLVKPQLKDVLAKAFTDTIQQGFSLEQQVNHTTSDEGLELWLSVGTGLMRDDAGTPGGVVILVRDLTATREMERLRELDRMKTQFVSNVSHELRTPLTCIKAYTEALQDMVPAEGQPQEFLKVIDSESDRLLALIGDLLNISRLQSGKVHLTKGAVNVPELIADVTGLSKLQSEKHQLVVQVAERLPEIHADRDRLREALINLVANAIKYSPGGGPVRIAARLDEGNLRIDVTDQGLGIPPESIDRLFDQFYRVDTPETAGIGGTGLGLTIVKSVVEAHEGVVRVRSELGRGSTFSIVLPLKSVTSRIRR